MAIFNGYLVGFSPLEAGPGGPVTLTAPAWSTTTSVNNAQIQFDQSLTAPLIASTASVASPQINLEIFAPSIGSTAVVQTPFIGLAGLLDAPLIPSTVVIGAPIVAGPLTSDAWVETTQISNPIVAGPLTSDIWTATTQIPNPIVAGPLTADAWISSTAIGINQIGAFLFPGIIASTASVASPLIALKQILDAPAWSTSTSVDTPIIAVSLMAPFIASTASVGEPTLVGPLLAPLIQSTAQVLTPDIRRIIEFALDVTTGSTRGGEDIILLGSALDMSDCTPTYTNGTLDAGFWTDLSTNSGSVVEVASTQSLQFNTGITPNSVAGIRSNGLASDLDIEIQATSLVADSIIQSAAELALYVDANTDLRLTVLNGRITLTIRENGFTSLNQAIATTAGNPQLRLLRVGNEVSIFLGGRFVTKAFWVNTNCQIEIRARNNSVRASQVALRVSRYTRRPVIVFGDSPVTDVTVVSRDQAVATTPARKLPGVVDIELTGCSTVSDTIPSAFTYFLDPQLARVFNVPFGPRMTAISDPAVTGRVGRSL